MDQQPDRLGFEADKTHNLGCSDDRDGTSAREQRLSYPLRDVAGPSFPDDFDQHPFPPSAVKLPVKDPLPRADVEIAVGHRDHHLATHDLPY